MAIQKPYKHRATQVFDKNFWVTKDLRVEICDAGSPEHFPHPVQVWDLK